MIPDGILLVDLLNSVEYDKSAAAKGGLEDISQSVDIRRAGALLYKAAQAAYQMHQQQIEDYWRLSDTPMAILYRQIMRLELPVLKRESVKIGKSSEAKGCCLGLTRGNHPVPYVYATDHLADIIGSVVFNAKLSFPNSVTPPCS